jgi:hypothetical protein
MVVMLTTAEVTRATNVATSGVPASTGGAAKGAAGAAAGTAASACGSLHPKPSAKARSEGTTRRTRWACIRDLRFIMMSNLDSYSQYFPSCNLSSLHCHEFGSDNDETTSNSAAHAPQIVAMGDHVKPS